jgi:hypothetical protein
LGPTPRPSEIEDERPTSNTSISDINWVTQIIDQTLSESPRIDTYVKDYEAFFDHTTSILREVRETEKLPLQNTIDDVYSTLVLYYRQT